MLFILIVLFSVLFSKCPVPAKNEKAMHCFADVLRWKLRTNTAMGSKRVARCTDAKATLECAPPRSLIETAGLHHTLHLRAVTKRPTAASACKLHEMSFSSRKYIAVIEIAGLKANTESFWN